MVFVSIPVSNYLSRKLITNPPLSMSFLKLFYYIMEGLVLQLWSEKGYRVLKDNSLLHTAAYTTDKRIVLYSEF